MKISQLLSQKHGVVFEKLRQENCIGYSHDLVTDPWHRLIRLDPRMDCNPARIYLHELIHLQNPTMPEKEVARWEAMLWKKITYKQVIRLFRMMNGAG